MLDQSISLVSLKESDKAWFVSSMIRSSLNAYRKQIFFIKDHKKQRYQLLGQHNFFEKEKWLQKNAENLFNSHIIHGSKFHHSYAISWHGIKVGAILIQYLPKFYEVYISTIFIMPEHQKSGFGSAALKKVLDIYPRAKQYIITTRHQNTQAFALYNKNGFEVSPDCEIVKKVGLDPTLYIGFTKDNPKYEAPKTKN